MGPDGFKPLYTALGFQAWLEQLYEQTTGWTGPSWASSSRQAAGAVAGYKVLHGPQFAEVVDVKPVMKTVRMPRQQS